MQYLRKVFPLFSCQYKGFLFLSHWRNRSDRVGTQGTNKQVKQVVQPAVKKKDETSKQLNIRTHETSRFAGNWSSIFQAFVSFSVDACVFRLAKWESAMKRPTPSCCSPSTAAQGQTQGTHTHMETFKKVEYESTYTSVFLHNHLRSGSQDHVEIQDASNSPVG